MTQQEIEPFLTDLDLILPAQPLTLDQTMIDQWLPALIEKTAGHCWLGVDLELDAIQREQIRQTATICRFTGSAPKIEYLENDDAFATDVLRHIDEGAKMTNPFSGSEYDQSRLATREQLQQAFWILNLKVRLLRQR